MLDFLLLEPTRGESVPANDVRGEAPPFGTLGGVDRALAEGGRGQGVLLISNGPAVQEMRIFCPLEKHGASTPEEGVGGGLGSHQHRLNHFVFSLKSRKS